MHGGIFLCIDCLLSLTCGLKVFALFFITFDGLGSSVGHVFDSLGCIVGGVIVISASSMPMVLGG